MSTVTGGCFCGEVRLEVQGPENYACFCHCESCQRAAGAPLVAWATYARDTFKVTNGEVHRHVSSPGVTRGICRNCGTSLTYENVKRPGEIDLTLNCLDDPTAPELKAHIWTEDAQPWMTFDDGLPVFERNAG